MRHRHKIGRRFARGNRPDRKKSRTGGRGAREHAASTSQHQRGEIFGGLQNSNRSTSSVGVLLLPRRTGDDTHTRHAATSCSFPPRCRQSSPRFYTRARYREASSILSVLLSLGHQPYVSSDAPLRTWQDYVFVVIDITNNSPRCILPPER